MNYAGIIKNDVVNGEGVCVSFFTQGCPHHCQGCFNPETWDPNLGSPLPANYKEQIASALVENNIQRNLSILGGDPLAEYNRELINELLCYIRPRFPRIKIYLWTGYQMAELLTSTDPLVQSILEKINYLIDGPFIESQKDLTLKLRGSSNQQVWERTKKGCWRNITKYF